MQRLCTSVVVVSAACLVTAGEIGYLEDFALAKNREEVLAQLIPGTPEYYYYHCLHYQNQGRLDDARKMLDEWIKRHDRQGAVEEMENRQALLGYTRDPKGTLEFLARRLGLAFNHQREIVGETPKLPIALDPASISRATLTQRALRDHPKTTEGFTDRALFWLAGTKLGEDERRHLLSRLAYPDVPGLVQMIIDDLHAPKSQGFGSLEIHKRLTLEQLDECVKLMPELLNHVNYVEAYLRRLAPNPDENWRQDAKAREAYLQRLWSFAARLNAAHNSLKAHVLYHRLVHDRALGVYDKQRFMTYLALPRAAAYMNRNYLELEQNRRVRAELGSDFKERTALAPIGDDEALVRSFLLRFFATEDDTKPYESFLDDKYLAHAFAETKIVNGLGDMEKWYSLLPPEKYQALKERIDLDFEFANKTAFAPDELVTLEVCVKNVKTLFVKVFELNPVNYYTENLREIDASVNLDGLVANEEKTYTYDDPPLRRVTRKFEFPALRGRGVYAIDFIGNGKSSRAVVRKGSLGFLEKTTPAGHAFTVLDESNRKIMDASLQIGGHRLTAGKDGAIMVPFTQKPGLVPLVLIQGSFAVLDRFQHQAEQYALQAGIHVEREALLTRKKAQVVVRPCLTLNGTPVSLSLLEDVKLLLTARDRDGVPATKEVAPFALLEEKESVYEFQVPANLATIRFALEAKVKCLSRNEKVELAAAKEFALSEIDATEKIEDLHLMRIQGGYVLEVLGRTGEVKADRPVAVSLAHRDFSRPIDVMLKTDGDGRVTLGPLTDIGLVKVRGPEGTERGWYVIDGSCRYPGAVHAKAGEDVALPWVDGAQEATRQALALFEVRGGVLVRDRFAALEVEGGFLKLKGLPAGDYTLVLKDYARPITVRVAAGEVGEGYVLSPYRQLERALLAPLTIAQAAVEGDDVVVRLGNASKWARVHVVGARYVPDNWLDMDMDVAPSALPETVTRFRPETIYVTGRDIGDEYRYILERKYAKKYPGAMLTRPSMLLTPWAVRSTETGAQEAQGGMGFGGGKAGAYGQRWGKGSLKNEGGAESTESGGFANLDFLGETAAVLLNLVPDKDGVVRVKRAALGAHQYVHVLAVDPFATVCRRMALPEVDMRMRDLRLADGLPPEKHFTEQKTVTVAAKGAKWTLPDITTAEFETYDTLAKVYRLFATLSGNATLAEFGFVLQWPTLDANSKGEKYAEFACHELDFFLYKKDPKFFQEVVKPALAEKKDKTFLDKWLLGEDLAEYLAPWAYGQLNIVERILLGMRVKEEQAAMARHVGELCDLLPPDVERANQLFATALKGKALETSDALGVEVEREKLMEAKDAERAKAPAAQANAALKRRAVGGPAGGARAAGAAPAADAAPEARPAEAPAEEAELARPEGENRLASLEKAAGEPVRGELLGDFVEERKAVRQLFRQLDKTMEWAENNYYKLPIEAQNAELITVNAFWRDYARHGEGAFFSTHLAEASRNFTEIMFALAVLDLPFEAAAHQSAIDGARFTLTPGSPMVIFHKEIKDAAASDDKAPILVSQNFYRHGERYRQVGNEQLDNYIRDEFLVHTVYGCNVVITNPTSSRRKLEVLLQVPVGAIPVAKGKQTHSLTIDLEPYRTWTADYFFYFPAKGAFPQYPVHVAKDEKLVAFAPPCTFNVVETPSKIDRASWEFVSQHGSEDDVFAYINANNLGRVALEKIAWRVQDAKFFDAVIPVLRTRHAFHPVLWSYALKHDRPREIKEFLTHNDAFVGRCGAALASELLVIDPVIRKAYQHLEYWPLVNARAHRLGKTRQILNDRFCGQYMAFMRVLSYLPALDDEDRLSLVCYLLLQDRFEEAFASFTQIKPDKLATRLQYDYCEAYLGMVNGDTARSRTLATKYASYGHERWRKLFAAVAVQLDELDGKAAGAVVDDKDKSQAQAALAAGEASFDLEVEGRTVTLKYQNLRACTLNYYVMDIELLFSRNPFVGQYAGQCAYIRPNATEERALDGAKDTATFELPAQFQARNVMIEIAGAGVKKSKAYFANALTVQLIENYGQVKVAAQKDGKPLAAVYVKVYAKQKDGAVRFYKDGYTDLRGRFDYASLSTNDLDRVERFSILIMSEEHGAVVREAAPPKQ